ncbi:MAG: RagB/SusD family nutrient uptake outer membrane protein, partial [Bacteroidales bacterium]|nr:RagB/SusD family nutrient uptake outer membrane protein [Bacteroidales bacterium]
MMRKRLIYFTVFTSLLLLGACEDFLDLEPLDRVSKEYLFETPAGVKTLMATLYNRLPIEDFVYRPGGGFNQHPGGGSGPSDGGWSLASNSDEAIIYGPSGYSSSPTSGLAEYWDYTSVRYVNQF